MAKRFILNNDVQPFIGGECSQDECPSYDGKRCRAIGFRPDRWCEPFVIEMRAALVALGRARAEVVSTLGSSSAPIARTAHVNAQGAVLALADRLAALDEGKEGK